MLIPDYVKDPAVRKRITIEIRIARKMIRLMKKAGWKAYAVNDGEEFHRGLKTEKEVMEHAFAVEEASIYFKNPSLKYKDDEGKEHTVSHHAYLVFGNDGYDVVADWSYGEGEGDTFDEVMEQLSVYTDAIAEKIAR